MRILHTSDWHLGRTLEGRSRLPEQLQFIDQLADIVKEEGVNLILVTGDVFDTYNPSAEAEELFFYALERLATGGKRAVVIIAGNHDSPDRIRAANPLALKHGISLVGYPGEKLTCGGSTGGVERVRTGKGWLEIAVPDAEQSAVIVTLPYPSESRLNELLSRELDEGAQQVAYSDRIKQILEESSRAFRADTVNLVAGHFFMAGGWESQSERPIQLGGALAVEPAALPSHAHYIALGHLHRPQAVEGTPAPCRYSGSPLAYSFSEANQQKEVVIVDAVPDKKTLVKEVKLNCGRPLKRWQVDSLEEVYAWCNRPENLKCWVELEMKLQEPLSSSQLAELRKLHPGIVNVRVILPEVERGPDEKRLSKMSLPEQFKLFVTRQRGVEPSKELVDFFLELVNEELGDLEDRAGGEAD
ncbi:exonuclease SbcCD subunit D [Calderihabitans maritimus]|uniref:Nuclease SbcCD subunit D n=1 Tax=Calderihabitans maritimus TaxID=1246530 RepID=A0A1Z5HY54_9FIRM|nr:exonuclease SbcCD subunit D C-terminal domain-containing protein [Calderihabitans maritimus]GAW94338.1 hypothetical protein KKC1_34460 [Calderihabitans maritimus]